MLINTSKVAWNSMFCFFLFLYNTENYKVTYFCFCTSKLKRVLMYWTIMKQWNKKSKTPGAFCVTWQQTSIWEMQQSTKLCRIFIFQNILPGKVTVGFYGNCGLRACDVGDRPWNVDTSNMGCVCSRTDSQMKILILLCFVAHTMIHIMNRDTAETVQIWFKCHEYHAKHTGGNIAVALNSLPVFANSAK